MNFRNIINNLESEIDWQYKSINKKDLPKNFQEIFLDINGIIVKVLYNNPNLFELIKEKFKVTSWSYSNSPIFCFHDKKQRAKWFIDRENQIAEIFGNGFWIMKSELSWFINLIKWWLPIHSAGISTNEIWWNIIVAWRNWWKSTAILHLIELCKNHTNKILLSDDWISLNDWKLIWFDPSISLEPWNITENLHLLFLENYKNIDRKTSMDIKNWFEWYWFWESCLDNVILLTQWMTKLITEWKNLEEISDFIIKATYHYPYNQEIMDSHREQWISELQSRNIFIYDRDFSKDKISWFQELISAIKK